MEKKPLWATMTSDQVLDAYRRKDELEKIVADLKPQLERAESELYAAKAVSEVYDGIPISVRQTVASGWFVAAASHVWDRGEAEVFPDMTTSGKFMVKYWKHRGPQHSKALRGAWPEDEALKIAKDWVVHGRLPGR